MGIKRISTEAYQALRNVIPVTTWNKRPFETLVRTAFRECPELLVGINFGNTKRQVADELVCKLIDNEDKYQDLSLRLMMEFGETTTFPNIEQITDDKDRQLRLEEAKAAVANMKLLVSQYSSNIKEKELAAAAKQSAAAQTKSIRQFNDDVETLRSRFVSLQSMTDVRQRGLTFERLLSDLFLLYDLEPRLSYNIDLEQIDGSFTLETDDYIVEARWRSVPSGRDDADVFCAKVKSKGKNALGLFVSIMGFASTFLERFKESTPFITMDGSDLYAVFENRVRLDDLLRAKKRHANDTGSCHLPYSQVISSDN